MDHLSLDNQNLDCSDFDDFNTAGQLFWIVCIWIVNSWIMFDKKKLDVMKKMHTNFQNS